MPAMTNPLPESQPAAKPAPVHHKPSRWPALLVLLACVGAGAAAYYYLTSARQAQAQQAAFTTTRTATVHRGPIETRVRLTGQTSARNFVNIVAPRLRGPDSGHPMVLLKIVASGTLVKKGDVVAQFDPQDMQDHLDDTIAGLQDKINDVKKKVVQNEVDMEALQQTLRVAKANVDKAQFDLKTTEIRMDIDRELLRLQIEEANATYKELSTDLPLEKTSQAADLRISEIAKKIEDVHVERHQEDINRLVIRAPMDGMVVLQTMFRPGGDQVQLAVGDRAFPGMQIMKVIDPKTMQVEGTINQAEIGAFRIGQGARIALDAFPGAEFRGQVYAIGALAVSGGRQQYYLRSVPVRVQIESPDKRVIPDLSRGGRHSAGEGRQRVGRPAGRGGAERQLQLRVREDGAGLREARRETGSLERRRSGTRRRRARGRSRPDQLAAERLRDRAGWNGAPGVAREPARGFPAGSRWRALSSRSRFSTCPLRDAARAAGR